jgi:hypothetical protein
MLLRLFNRSSDGLDRSPAPEGAWLLLLNGGGRSRSFALPALSKSDSWTELLNTAHPVERTSRAGSMLLSPRSLVLLRAATDSMP